MPRPEGQNDVSPRLKAILDAGIRVISKGGMRGLTHRAVDAEAGIPEGSTSGYYRTRMALVVAISEWLCRLLAERVAAIGAQLLGGEEIERVADASIEVLVRWIADEDLVIAHLELTTEAIRHPEVDEVLRPFRRAAVGLVTEMMVVIGVDDPDAHAQASLASVEGVIFAAVAQPREEREGYVRQVAPIVISGFGTLKGLR